jgi:DNA-binding response OmpR family regulator
MTAAVNKPEVLVIDDDRFQCELVEASLKGAGITVQIARSADEAIEMINNGYCPKLIISDIHMPGGSGLEFLNAVRRAKLTTPVIFMSSDGSYNEAKLTDFGGNGFIKKPFQPKSLLIKVIVALRKISHPEAS